MYQNVIFTNVSRTVLSQDKDLMSGKALGAELLRNSPTPGVLPHLPPPEEGAEMRLATLLVMESPGDKEKHMGHGQASIGFVSSSLQSWAHHALAGQG